MDTVDVERLKRLRAQMLVHSYIYYWMGSSIWTDDKWQKKADELESLQKAYKDVGLDLSIGFYDDAFSDWTGATGTHLPRDDYIVGTALYIYRLHSKKDVDFNNFAGV